MTKNKTFLLEQQYGGMLVEIMMTLAISAIMIPFIFRYQQNAVERARNIAISKQMEMVQGALEKYIVKNRSTYINHSGSHTWDNVHICHLIDEKFLSDDFSNDCSGSDCISECRARKSDSNDFGKYFLRVLKTAGQDGHDILQGVVLLTNEETTPLRTRGIVNMGGGKIGYIDGTNVRGGFNVFVRPKTDMGLSNQSSGVVGATGTLRGSNEYLWRVPSANDMDATMLSPLNLDGHDVVNINEASVYNAFFDTELNAKEINIQNTLYFLYRPTFNTGNFVFNTAEAEMRGLLSASGHSTLSVEQLKINPPSGYDAIESSNMQSNIMLDMNSIQGLQNLTIGSSSAPVTFEMKASTANLGAKVVDVEVGRDINIVSDADKVAGISPRLRIENKILPANEDNRHYWDIKEQKVFLPNVALTNLPRALYFGYCYTHDCNAVGSPLYPVDSQTGDGVFHVFSDEYLFEGGNKITKNTPFVQVLDVNLCKIQEVIKIKIKCLLTSGWNEFCKAVKNNDYDAYTKHCRVGAI